MEELLERYEMDEWREPISVSACPPRFVCFDSIIRARIAELRRQAVASAIRVKVAALKLCEPSPLRGVVSCEQSRDVDARLSLGCENVLAVGPGVHVHQLNGMRGYSDLIRGVDDNSNSGDFTRNHYEDENDSSGDETPSTPKSPSESDQKGNVQNVNRVKVESDLITGCENLEHGNAFSLPSDLNVLL